MRPKITLRCKVGLNGDGLNIVKAALELLIQSYNKKEHSTDIHNFERYRYESFVANRQMPLPVRG